jgi:hypothetical protein
MFLIYTKRRKPELGRFKFLGKFKLRKEKHDKEIVTYETEESVQPDVEVTSEEKAEEQPVKDYYETLYSKEIPKKMSLKESKSLWKKKSWEGVNAVEKNIDSLYQAEERNRQRFPDDINKKVDKLLSKKKS